jgi:hypothetical protein
MAIVARRVLQRLIRENAAFTSLEQRERHAKALDEGSDLSLSVEWEVLILNALSKSATVSHEALLGTKRPDVLATVRNGSAEECFIADIATAFETGARERNPIEALSDEIHGLARKLGLNGHGLYIHVEGEKEGKPGMQQMVLKLPRRSEISAFLADRVDPFLRLCAAEPTQRRELVVRDSRVDLQLEFRPNEITSGRSHPSFTAIYSRTKNPVFNTLKRKAQQLKQTGFEGPRGVILCAGDANLSDSSRGSQRISAVISELFRQNASISFVFTIWADDPVFKRGRYGSKLYASPNAIFPISHNMRALLVDLPSRLPEPRNSGINALNELEVWRASRGRYFYGGWEMTDATVRISVRFLMEYLAGRVGREEFIARHGGDQGFVSLFEQKLRRGQLLVGAEISPQPDKDDDWIIFRFGPADPALAPMQAE